MVSTEYQSQLTPGERRETKTTRHAGMQEQECKYGVALLVSFITDWAVDPPTCDCEYILVVVTSGPGVMCACMTEFARMDGLFEDQTCKRKNTHRN